VTLKEELAQAQSRITELEAVEQIFENVKEQLSKLEAANAELMVKICEQGSALEAHAEDAKDKLTYIEKLEGEAKELTAKVEKLESEKTSIEAAADSKAREIAARNGADLPPKKQGAGNKEIENAEAQAGTPQQKLAAIFEPKL
jgi:chromosome segregation ATPase